MKRADALKAIEAAGLADDQKAYLRIFTESRISSADARAAFARGRDMAKRFAHRGDVQKNPENLYMGDAA